RVISYHLGSRERLVAEEQAERYVADGRAEADRLATAVAVSTSPDDFRAACLDIVRARVSAERTASRFKQASALGAGIERPDLRELLAEQQHAVTERVATSVAQAQRRGLFCADLDPFGVAEVISALSFGFVLSDLDGGARSRDGVVGVLDRFISSLVAA
ncbi:MAG: TetR family transcriptional regulator C-terminal domain-containing protein, partial [Ilumatobacteraceae bacterium]